jgi:hypothetical protein
LESQLTIRCVPIGGLILDPANARTHDGENLAAIEAASTGSVRQSRS